MSGATPAGLPYRANVGLMLINAAGFAFCGERRDTPGAWQMPQGGIDAGEAPEAAAWRELHEEIGVTSAALLARSAQPYRYDFPPDLARHQVFKGRYRGQEQHWFLLRFTGTDDEICLDSPGDPQGPEFTAWRWVQPAELPGLVVPFKRPVYEAVVTEFAPLMAAR